MCHSSYCLPYQYLSLVTYYEFMKFRYKLGGHTLSIILFAFILTTSPIKFFFRGF